MRIHLPLEAKHFTPASSSSSSSGSSSASPLIQLGGDLVLVELQGELSWEGDKDDGVIGVIGLDRPDKPTLHLGSHHLLHGKFMNLPKPYAVIRKSTAPIPSASSSTPHVNGQGTGTLETDEESSSSSEEEEEELFPDPSTPLRGKGKSKLETQSSSPVYVPTTPMDYSSDLEPISSPASSEYGFSKRLRHNEDDDDDDDDEAEREVKRIKLKSSKEKEKERQLKRKRKKERREKERTRHYEVVGVVRRKVVFHLRPEPLVAPTILPD